MQINKPKFWDSEIGIISILLLPLSMVVITYIFLKKFLCKKTSFKIPVVCVGNIRKENTITRLKLLEC